MKNLSAVFRPMLSALVLGLALLSAACSGSEPPPGSDHSVEKVDLMRYTGLWYEIASLPAQFQKGCVCTTALYLPRGEKLGVVNACRMDSPEGEERIARGNATPVEGSQGSRLKVQFFWPFSADYWIVGLDPDYQWAMVGNPEKTNLWILSRTPRMDPALYAQLVDRAKELGYDVGLLHLTPQEGCPPPPETK